MNQTIHVHQEIYLICLNLCEINKISFHFWNIKQTYKIIVIFFFQIKVHLANMIWLKTFIFLRHIFYLIKKSLKLRLYCWNNYIRMLNGINFKLIITFNSKWNINKRDFFWNKIVIKYSNMHFYSVAWNKICSSINQSKLKHLSF